MKIGLIFPPARFLIDEKVNPPLGLGYLSSYLKFHGHKDISIYHITDKDSIPKINADIIGIGFTTSQFNDAVHIQKELKKSNPNSLFVAGGIHATSKPTECLDAGFDTVIVGEGEKALLNIINKYDKGDQVDQVVHGKEIRNIDDIPFPDYAELKMNTYKFNFKGKNFASMFTSRGCPMRCRYCASPTIWKKVRLNSIDYVKKHIDYLRNNFDVEAIMFQDDVFTMGKKRMQEIGEYLHSISMPYRCLAKASDLDKKTVKTLVDTGCIEVGVGIESGNQKMLDTMNKKTTVEQNRQALINCKEIGLSIKAFVLLGIPGESKESIEDTINLLEEIPPNDIDVNILVIYPGTFFYQNIEKYDIKQDIKDYDKQYVKGKIGTYEPTISTNTITRKELEFYRKLIFNKFSRLVKK